MLYLLFKYICNFAWTFSKKIDFVISLIKNIGKEKILRRDFRKPRALRRDIKINILYKISFIFFLVVLKPLFSLIFLRNLA